MFAQVSDPQRAVLASIVFEAQHELPAKRLQLGLVQAGSRRDGGPGLRVTVVEPDPSYATSSTALSGSSRSASIRPVCTP